MFTKTLLATAALALALGSTSQVANAQGMAITSTTFKDGQMMPKKVANKPAATNPNPNCVGENVSPQLSWTGTPAGTKSFAMLMEDPEGRGGAGVHHWVAYGIPADVTSFAEGEVSKDGPKFVGGKSTQGVGFYSGPCTPPGSPHHYTFVIVATDFDAKELAPGLTREDFLAKLVPQGGMSHAKGSAGIVGLFVKPAN
jgi:Raf kinase inhibitor-like YbhB/YbcL family protein